MAEFTHFNESGRARMVDVGAKASTERLATAQATVFLQPETLEKIRQGKIAKGDVLAVAQVAGVMGAKKTPDLIPMCHPILLTGVDISFTETAEPDQEGRCAITITATAKTTYGTCGVKVWVFKGEVLAHDPMAQDKRMAGEPVSTDGGHQPRRERRERDHDRGDRRGRRDGAGQ